MYSSPKHADNMRRLAETRYWEEKVSKAERNYFAIGVAFGFAAACLMVTGFAMLS